MAFERKVNTWSLFRNTEKKSDTSPDYSGTVDVDGKEYKINGWMESNGKISYIKGSVRPAPSQVQGSDDIPF